MIGPDHIANGSGNARLKSQPRGPQAFRAAVEIEGNVFHTLQHFASERHLWRLRIPENQKRSFAVGGDNGTGKGSRDPRTLFNQTQIKVWVGSRPGMGRNGLNGGV